VLIALLAGCSPRDLLLDGVYVGVTDTIAGFVTDFLTGSLQSGQD